MFSDLCIKQSYRKQCELAFTTLVLTKKSSSTFSYPVCLEAYHPSSTKKECVISPFLRRFGTITLLIYMSVTSGDETGIKLL